MKKNKNKSKKIVSPTSIEKLKESRNGGQNALRGYSYQYLYSCYLILSSEGNASFQLEGIEDIDRIEQNNENNDIIHIQVKYSINKQDASFLKSVLENFLQAYLLDQNRSFKLVYDFPVATGHLSRLFDSKLDKNTLTYWRDIISNIKQDTPDWDWSAYDFDEFISHLSFENIKKDTLAASIENALIDVYEITTDNITLFANSIKILCLEKMEQREYITKNDIDNLIQSVKIDISKGPQNPAHSWIRKLDFSTSNVKTASSFYEGKKATPADIASGLPIKRKKLENDVINSINENTVTVIKASSGQGKTTLALQAAYFLQKENNYTPYQLLWCNDIKELGNIVQYFKARIQLGERILILIDNLDHHLSKWNDLTQLLQSELPCHYKLLVTSREIDWYNYSGDLSNIHSPKIIKPTLCETDAKEIFSLFKTTKHLHPNITNWQKAWNQIAERQLLIEYIYLLTHGEMLSERIASQISKISQSSSGKTKCEILRRVCFADLCGVKLSIESLHSTLSKDSDEDFGSLIKSMESEFLVYVNTKIGYVEGLHPIRSKHIVENLHEFLPIDNTAISVIEMANKTDIPILFSHLPEFDINRKHFFSKVIDILWNAKDLSTYISAIQGLFSGSVMQYYQLNQTAFNDANAHGGLPLVSTELCPFATFREFDVSADTLNQMLELLPNNENINYLCELRDRIPSCNLQETYIYSFCECLYRKLSQIKFSEIIDVESYASISEWIYNIDASFNLSVNIPLEEIWIESDKLSLDCISTLMYVSFCGNKKIYLEFVKNNQKNILSYLKQKTKSHKLFIDTNNNSIHVKYILQLRDINTGNEKSVSRLDYICKTLPIFDLYCSDALKPSLNFLSAYTIPDDTHKEMPLNNIVRTFHQNLVSLWNDTIMSYYEFDTIAEWLNNEFDVREHICTLAQKFCDCMYKLLNDKALGNLGIETDHLREQLNQITTGEKLYPKEKRPFEKGLPIAKNLKKEKNEYVNSFKNFSNQFVGFLRKDDKAQMAMNNLIAAQSTLLKMQHSFEEIIIDSDLKERHLKLCNMEMQAIEQLVRCCYYYQSHSPSKYFDKYQIKNWYIEHCRDERKKVERLLSPLQSKYKIYFPDQTYVIDISSYYPVVIDGFNIFSENDLLDLFYNCLSFVDTSFDYLVILSTNNTQDINPTALKISKQMLAAIKKGIESENEVSEKQTTMAYPIDVTQQMLECFHEKFDLPINNYTNGNIASILDLLEELWSYSKSVELLTDMEDKEYLTSLTQNIHSNITNLQYELNEKLEPKDYKWLRSICDDVFSGKTFDDEAINYVIDYFIQKELNENI